MKNAVSLFLLVYGLNTVSGAEILNSPNRFSFSARFGFGIEANFRDVGPSTLQSFGPPSGGRIDRTYSEDGKNYVRVDSRNNSGGTTWYWGYTDPAQVDTGAGTIQFEGLGTRTGTDITGVEDGNHPGGEFNYTRLLGSFGGAHLGLELALNYTHVDISDSTPASGTVTRITDTYSLNGITPPAAPYEGTFAGPGPLIGDSPTRSTSIDSLNLTGERRMDAKVWGIKLGPVLDIPMDEWFSLQLSGGLTTLYVDGELAYNEQITFGSGGFTQPSGSAAEAEWLFGGYLRGQLSISLSDRMMLFAGGEYLSAGTYEIRAGAREGELDFGGAIYVNGGLTFSF